MHLNPSVSEIPHNQRQPKIMGKYKCENYEVCFVCYLHPIFKINFPKSFKFAHALEM